MHSAPELDGGARRDSLQEAVMVREPAEREVSTFLGVPWRPRWACLKQRGSVVGVPCEPGAGGKEGVKWLPSPLILRESRTLGKGAA